MKLVSQRFVVVLYQQVALLILLLLLLLLLGIVDCFDMRVRPCSNTNNRFDLLTSHPFTHALTDRDAVAATITST